MPGTVDWYPDGAIEELTRKSLTEEMMDELGSFARPSSSEALVPVEKPVSPAPILRKEARVWRKEQDDRSDGNSLVVALLVWFALAGAMMAIIYLLTHS